MAKRKNKTQMEVNVNVKRDTHLSNSECKMKGKKLGIKDFSKLISQHETVIYRFHMVTPFSLGR